MSICDCNKGVFVVWLVLGPLKPVIIPSRCSPSRIHHSGSVLSVSAIQPYWRNAESYAAFKVQVFSKTLSIVEQCCQTWNLKIRFDFCPLRTNLCQTQNQTLSQRSLGLRILSPFQNCFALETWPEQTQLHQAANLLQSQCFFFNDVL